MLDPAKPSVRGGLFAAATVCLITLLIATFETSMADWPSGLLLLLVLSYAGALLSPPPSNIKALAVGGLVFGWLFVGIAGWVDAHREGVAG